MIRFILIILLCALILITYVYALSYALSTHQDTLAIAISIIAVTALLVLFIITTYKGH